MNEKIVLLIAVMVVSVGFLSGCTNSENFEDTNSIALLDYSVESYKFGKEIYSPNIKLGDGFNYKEDMVGFKVYGSIQNNEGEPLSKIKVIGNFYDGNKFLGISETIIENIPDGETRDFNVFFHSGDFPDDYLLVVDNVQFEFKIVRVQV